MALRSRVIRHSGKSTPGVDRDKNLNTKIQGLTNDWGDLATALGSAEYGN